MPFVRRALFLLAVMAVATLVACGPQSRDLTGPSSPNAMISTLVRRASATAGQSILYIANGENATITMYDADSNKPAPAPLGIINQGLTRPVALAVDAKGDLFVANATTTSTPANVEMYPPNALQPSVTYTSSITDPIALAIDGRSTLYVANQTAPSPAPYFAGPSIVAFPSGSTTPSETLTDPNALAFTSLVVDRERNLYVGYDSYLCCPASAVDELMPNAPQPLVLAIAAPTEGSSSQPFRGLALDAAGGLAASDGTRVGVYAPTAQTWPAAEASKAFGQNGAPSALAFNAVNTKLFVADSGANEVFGFSYPDGQIINEFTKDVFGPTAVAVGPRGSLPIRPSQPTKPPKPPSLAPGTIYGINDVGVTAYNARTFSAERALGIKDSIYPMGGAVDPLHRFYLGERSRSSQVAVFEPHAKRPFESFGAPDPQSVAVGSDGTLAASGPESNEIVVYVKGAMPPVMLTPDGDVYAVALDNQDDVYVSIFTQQGSYIAEFARSGSGYGPEVHVLTLPRGAGYIGIDGNGDLLTQSDEVDVYLPGQASPQYAIGRRLFELGEGFVLDQRGAFLYSVDYGSVLVFRYPSGTPYAHFLYNPGYQYVKSIVLDPPAPSGPPWSPGGSARGTVTL